ncbi:MAG: hypothetical protein P4L79_10745 [Legionella sp.]|uniref:hypothetical protein n=1 Tax=Legionella sp. TaxID=459 RepID=UPI0028501BA9|nr:hypothetical protein [Legionella sp.]
MAFSSNGTNDAIMLSAVPAQNTVLQTDTILIVSGTQVPAVMQAPLSTAFSNVSVIFGNLIVSTNATPANSTSTANVVTNSIWTDGNYVYVGCVNNVVKRVALSTF